VFLPSSVKASEQKKSDAAKGATAKVDPAVAYSRGANHVLPSIHNILNQHQALEQRWHSKKLKLQQSLALRIFQNDASQVANQIHYLCGSSSESGQIQTDT
jgi:uncharacterized protein YjcR